jgi:quinoprotein glucose dehydrogenase
VRAFAVFIAALSLASGARAESVWEGVFTADQAARGKALYAERCVLCHGENMEGTMSAPPLADVGFLYVWDGRPLGELFEFTKTTMPPNEVGSLSDAQIADLLAAILADNAYPAGIAELPADPAALSAITILREQ